jgi:hypothetical protein
VAEDQDLDLALTPVFGGWNEAEHAANDQVEGGELRGILREHHVSARASVFDFFTLRSQQRAPFRHFPVSEVVRAVFLPILGALRREVQEPPAR